MKGCFGGNPGPVFPRFDFTSSMTAIAIVSTSSGIIVAADGRSRWGEDATRDNSTSQHESDHEKKVFKAEIGAADVAWAVTGSVFNADRSFSLVAEVKKSFRAANEDPTSLFRWFDSFTTHLHALVSEARENGLLPPFTENENQTVGSNERFTFARIFMAGYFYGGKPAIAILRLSHKDGVLKEPQRMIFSPPEHDFFSGSDEVRKRYFEEHEDVRFKKYFRPSGSTLEEGLAHARGYIKACSDPLAAEIDPLCKG